MLQIRDNADAIRDNQSAVAAAGGGNDALQRVAIPAARRLRKRRGVRLDPGRSWKNQCL